MFSFLFRPVESCRCYVCSSCRQSRKRGASSAASLSSNPARRLVCALPNRSITTTDGWRWRWRLIIPTQRVPHLRFHRQNTTTLVCHYAHKSPLMATVRPAMTGFIRYTLCRLSASVCADTGMRRVLVATLSTCFAEAWAIRQPIRLLGRVFMSSYFSVFGFGASQLCVMFCFVFFRLLSFLSRSPPSLAIIVFTS